MFFAFCRFVAVYSKSLEKYLKYAILDATWEIRFPEIGASFLTTKSLNLTLSWEKILSRVTCF